MLSIWNRLIKYKQLMLILLAGLLVLFLVDNQLVGRYNEDVRNRERLRAEQLKAQVQSALEEHVTALIALKVVYQYFTDITHYDFQQYGASITANLHAFQRLFFIDPKMVIRQVYPLTPENRGLIDYSLKDEKPLVETLQRARSANSPTTSRLLPFLNHPRTFWAIIPVYRNNNRDFLGYAAAEINMHAVWQPLGHAYADYQVQLIDPAGTRLFSQVEIQGANRFDGRFNLYGQPWQLVLRPIAPASETLLLQRGSLWVGGLLILVLLGVLITTGKRHKNQLEEAHQQFETIVEASPDGILLLDGKLNLQLANPVVCQWLGEPQEALQGRNFFELFECQCPNVAKCPELSFLLCTSRRFSADLPEVLETRLINPPDGMPKTLRLNASRIFQDRDGRKEEGFICVLGDISTSKELERIKETYVATLTHDLKTPLLAQQMVLESLSAGSSGPITDEQKRLLCGARDSVQDLLDMVNATLLFYKLESAHVTLRRQKAKLPSIVRDVMTGLRPLAEKKELSLELDAAVELPDAWIDVVQMKRVLHNLLSNAISYGRRGTPIRVSLRTMRDEGRSDERLSPPLREESVSALSQDGARLLIEITNEGKGIAPEDLPRVFDKYYSLSRRFKQIGTGLGLYIVRRIVELHGGRVWAESEPGRETRFFVSLPSIETVDPVTPPVDAADDLETAV